MLTVKSKPKAKTKPKVKSITPKELKELGYEFTTEQIPLGDRPYKWGILHVKNVGNTKEVSFCYLFSTRSMTGMILPNPYYYYELHGVRNLANFLLEYGVN